MHSCNKVTRHRNEREVSHTHTHTHKVSKQGAIVMLKCTITVLVSITDIRLLLCAAPFRICSQKGQYEI